MEAARMWQVITTQREKLHELLRELDTWQWQAESLCRGWTVQDVAAHVISAPQLRMAPMLATLPKILLHGYDGMVLRDAQHRSRAGQAAILQQFERWAPVPKGPAMVPALETLTDTLVHFQDIVRPLGIEHHMPIEAAEAVARRLSRTGMMLGSRTLMKTVRMQAGDCAFAAGRGPAVSGPVEELVMLRAGRSARWELLSGPGAVLAREIWQERQSR